MNLAEGSIFAEHYQLLKQLGHGSFGDVWLAHNVLADIDVAIKFYGTLDQKGIEDFRNEFKIAYRLRHPNLLNINHFDVHENCPYLVMPYCANGSVSRQIGQMPESEIWKFILDVSGGLAFLHSQQPPVVHQDIKPDNILITSDGRYVISDFGISRTFRTKMSRTNNNSSSGTIAYMGPERFSEKPMIVLASDIWAFGMTLYELMTGDVLWEGMGGCVQLNGARIPAISGKFSPELANLVICCLAAETWNRPTATQINEYATAWLQHRILPPLPIQNVKPDYKPTPAPVPESQTIVHVEPSVPVHHTETVTATSRKSTINSRINQSKAYNPQTPNSGNPILKRGLLIAAAVIFGVLLITGGSMIISEINEQQDYLSCKTIQDYEQFIKDHPNSSYVEEARHHISSMTNNAPAPQALMQESRPDKPKQAEHVKNTSQTKTLYITEEEKPEQPEPEVPEEKEEPKKPVVPPTPKPDPNAADDQAFNSCVSARDYDNYLRNYPNGRHRAEASQELSALVKQSSQAHNNDYKVEDIPPSQTAAGSLPLNRQGTGVVETNSSVNVRFDGGGAGRFSSPPPVRSHGGNNYRGGGSGPRGSSFSSGGSSRAGSFSGGGSHSGSRGGGGSSHRHSR
jgi:serine/threonine protein kinase